MPSLAELHEEADAIRRESRIWDDPELCAELRSASEQAQRILGQYERSIAALQISNGPDEENARSPKPAYEVMEIAELPRFSDVAAPFLAGTNRALNTWDEGSGFEFSESEVAQRAAR